jgi:translation initiation factor 3 subunit H
MSGFVDALLGAQLNGGGIGGGAKAVPVERSAAAKGIMVTSSAPGSNKSGKGIALVFGRMNSEVQCSVPRA